jgi:hypothetical protein
VHDNASTDGDPLSPELLTSRTPPLPRHKGPSSLTATQPPRTLQDLLEWRQEMLQARMKEHTQRQREDSLSSSSSVSRRSPGSDGSRQFTQSPALLTPHVPSPPFLSLCSPQSSSQFSSTHSPVMQKEPTLAPGQLMGRKQGRETRGSPHTNAYAALQPLAKILDASSEHHLRLAKHSFKEASSSSSSSSGARSRTTSWSTVSKDKTLQQLKMAEFIRLHDRDAGQTLVLCFSLLFALLLILSFIFGGPWLPGGSLGFFY